MNKNMKKGLKNLKYGAREYGYIALKDYKKFYHLSSLDKIIKLKKPIESCVLKGNIYKVVYQIKHKTYFK